MSETREQQIGEAAEQLLRDSDVMVNELAPVPGALPDQTVSDHVARAAQDGKRWACLFCKLLSITVQKDHCANTLAGHPMPWTVYPRAAAMFVLVLGTPAWIPMLMRWITALLAAGRT